MRARIPFEEPTKGTSWARLLSRFALGVVLLVLIAKLAPQLRRELAALDAWIGELGLAAPFAFVGLLVVVIPLCFPVTAIKVAAGAIFNPFLAIGVVLAGQFGAALAIYFLARRFLAKRLSHWADREPRMATVRDAARRGTAKHQFLVRMTPLSFALVSYALAAMQVRLKPYLLGCLASVPSTVATVWFAHAARNVTTLADTSNPDERTWGWTSLAIAAAGLLALAYLVRMARPALLESQTETAVES